jgi:hypothetical protein
MSHFVWLFLGAFCAPLVTKEGWNLVACGLIALFELLTVSMNQTQHHTDTQLTWLKLLPY